MRGETPAEALTFDEFCDRFLERYAAIRTPGSVQTLAWRLARARKKFGDTKLAELRRGEIAAWEAGLPVRFRHAIMRAFRQVLAAAVEWGYVTQNAAVTGRNPAPSVLERAVLEPAEVEQLSAEMRSPFGAAVIVCAWAYLRPAELLGLERGDVGEGELRVRGTKTLRSLRSTPLPLRAREALDELPPRLDTRLLFPSPSGGLYDRRKLGPEGVCVGTGGGGPRRGSDAVRPSLYGVSWALHAGVPASDVARFAGTSLTMLEQPYAHLLSASTKNARARMDAFTNEAGEAAEGGQ